MSTQKPENEYDPSIKRRIGQLETALTQIETLINILGKNDLRNQIHFIHLENQLSSFQSVTRKKYMDFWEISRRGLTLAIKKGLITPNPDGTFNLLLSPYKQTFQPIPDLDTIHKDIKLYRGVYA